MPVESLGALPLWPAGLVGAARAVDQVVGVDLPGVLAVRRYCFGRVPVARDAFRIQTLAMTGQFR